MKQETELPHPTPEQIQALRRFASFEIGIEEFRRSMIEVFEFDLKPEKRTATGTFRVPEPGIAITRDHIAKALEQKRRGLISERELVHWASILLLNDAYVLDPNDEDFIAEWLNGISLNLDAS